MLWALRARVWATVKTSAHVDNALRILVHHVVALVARSTLVPPVGVARWALQRNAILAEAFACEGLEVGDCFLILFRLLLVRFDRALVGLDRHLLVTDRDDVAFDRF